MQDEYLSIEGLNGKRALEGKIKVGGAKNAVLKAISASMLFEGVLQLGNVPRLRDVFWLLEILQKLGVEHEFAGEHTLKLSIQTNLHSALDSELARKLRSSVVLSGPVLARQGKVSFPYPGGDKIGLRPIDLFLEAFQKLGAKVKEENESIYIEAPNGLKGAEIFFRRQSVTATESVMMAATLACGKTILKNAAMEPEIVFLAELLNNAGASIKGAGTPYIEIEGSCGRPLKAKEKIEIMPDRIEAGSFLALASVAGKDIVIENCRPSDMEAVLEYHSYIGVNFEATDNSLRVFDNLEPSQFKMADFVTHEYPGFPTDLQAPTVAALTQMSGEAVVFETIFEDRFKYIESLKLMGADILELDVHRVLIKGPRKLSGRTLRSIDIRAGLAYIIAAAVAEGQSKIERVFHIDRGYENIEQRLSQIGLNIKRESV